MSSLSDSGKANGVSSREGNAKNKVNGTKLLPVQQSMINAEEFRLLVALLRENNVRDSNKFFKDMTRWIRIIHKFGQTSGY